MYVAWVAGSLNRRYGPSAQQLPKAWSDISAVCVSIFDWLVSYTVSDWIILAKVITQLHVMLNVILCEFPKCICKFVHY